jgi:hypothetical protein
MSNPDQTRARLAALFDAPSAPESQPTTQQTNKFSVWQPEARVRAYTLLLTLERISDGNPNSVKFGQLAERIGETMQQEERAEASKEASQNLLTLSAALHCGQ